MSTQHVMDGRHFHTLPLSYTRLFLTLALVSCAPQPIQRQATFDPHEYAPYEKTGTSTISGQVSLKTGDGAVTSGGGCREVYLEPVTSYSTEWYEHEVIRNETLTGQDPRARTFRRVTATDGVGFFRFEKLPQGSYYVACRMQFDRWIMTGSRPTMFEETIWVGARVDLEHGQHGRVTLAP